MVIIRIVANAITMISCSEAAMYFVSQLPTRSVNLDEAHTPTIIEMNEMACEIKPFLIPCITAGIRQIKSMMSKMFINTLKCVYLRIEIFGISSRLQK